MSTKIGFAPDALILFAPATKVRGETIILLFLLQLRTFEII